MQAMKWFAVLAMACGALLSHPVLADTGTADEQAGSTGLGTAPQSAVQAGKTLRIPFTISRNKIVLKVRVNQSPELKVVLDTGMPFDGLLLYKKELKSFVGIDNFMDVQIGGAGGGENSRASMADSVYVHIEEVEFPDQRIIILQSDLLADFPGDGVIGYTLLGHYAVEIDYDDMVIKLHDKENVVVDPSWTRIPMTFKDNEIPWVDAVVNISGEKDVPVSIYIDLASGEALELLEREAMPFTVPEGLTEYYLGRGLSGDIYGHKGTIRSLRLGPHTLSDVTAAFVPAPLRSKQKGADGVLGNNTLRRFNAIFSYAEKRLYLKPNSYFEEPFESAQTLEDTPQKVYRFSYVVKPKNWYMNQKQLWKSEVLANPKNEDAWYNYFFAARYGWSETAGQTGTRDAFLDSIYHEMERAIPNSWVYHYIHYYNYGTDFSRLEKAYEMNPDSPDLYWEFIKEYALTGQKQKRREFCAKLYESEDISTGIYNLNYNILNSTERNSILFTNGDNDTYPAWVLQEAKDVRRDVLILTMHGTFGDRDYLRSILSDRGIDVDVHSLPDDDIVSYLDGLVRLLRKQHPDVPIHIARTVYGRYYAGFEDKMFTTGSVMTYSDVPLDNGERNKEVVENNLRLDYLDADWYADLHVSRPLVDRLNLTYVDAFLKLAEYYSVAGDSESADHWKNKASILVRRAHDEDRAQKAETRKG